MYNAECAPARIRGRIVGAKSIMMSLGACLAYWTNYIVRLRIDKFDRLIYQLPLGLQILPALVLGFGVLTIPQSNAIHFLTNC